MRRTKIICTLGPASDSPEMIQRMIMAGTNIFRLNMSHASHQWVRKVVRNIRAAERDHGAAIGILLDTQGPEIRTGDLHTDLQLEEGETLDFIVRGEKSEEVSSVDVNYEGLVDDISVGDVVLVDNGVIRFEVLEKFRHRVRCRVLTSGTLRSRRHINLPGVKVNIPPLTAKDKEDILMGADVGIDMIALSFCRSPEDIVELRTFLSNQGSSARIIAKIEDQSAVRNLEGIVRAADAVMVARGDLGVECALEELPIIQRKMIKMSIHLGKPVIVATHLLESMISSPMPTRAEVTDVANAVYEQADAIMLSGESAMGRYPVECVEILDRVARRIERSGGAGYGNDVLIDRISQKTTQAAITLANSLTNSRLVVFTRRGFMAGYASSQRPLRAAIFAFSPSVDVCRRLTLDWGVTALPLTFAENPGQTVDEAERTLREKGLVKSGDQLVIVSDVLAGEFLYDSIQLRTIQ